MQIFVKRCSSCNVELHTYNGWVLDEGWNEDWNSALFPTAFGKDSLGENWIDPDRLGAEGVANSVLDNRHVHSGLKNMICKDEGFRDYLGVLVDFAWPKSAQLHICCSEPAGSDTTSECQDPDYVVASTLKGDVLLAPHFLTEGFQAGQQEALTAGLIAKFNVHGKHMRQTKSRSVAHLLPHAFFW